VSRSPNVPDAAAAFSADAGAYTAQRRRLVPDFDLFYGAAVDAVGLGPSPCRRVLDLGAGTGLLSILVASVLPEARFELLDASEAMLAEARVRLAPVLDAVHVQDLAAGLPPGPFDAVISALAIHHLEPEDQRRLYAEVPAILAPGGIFLNAEQVGGSTAALDRVFDDRWGCDAARQGASPEEIEGARVRRRHDRCVPVAVHLGWLAEAGFSSVDCVYAMWGNAVLIARTQSDSRVSPSPRATSTPSPSPGSMGFASASRHKGN
jgi:tRNA (cmo5U34)-methyltransferase